MSCGCGSSTYNGRATGCGCGGGGGAAGGCRCGGGAAGVVGNGGFLRPRFFAGQLLTEDDLGAIVDYTTAKSRLHNRYQAGTGVVCGLEVACHPAVPGSVRLSAGYALDCCGEDIVVPCDLDIDINELIALMPRQASCDEPCPEHGTKGTRSGRPCRSYTLTVSYAEEPAEHLNAYPIDDQPCTSSDGAACEVSLVREGYRIGLRCGRPEHGSWSALDQIRHCVERLCPPEQKEDATSKHPALATRAAVTAPPVPPSFTAAGSAAASPDPAWVEALLLTPLPRSWLAVIRRYFERLLPCEQRLAALAGTSEPTKVDRQFLVDVRQRLIEHLETVPLTSCSLLCDVTAVTAAMIETDPTGAAGRLDELFRSTVRECVCRALNPPPPPCDDPAVPLATVCVDACEVVSICNSVRRFVLTGSALAYWLPMERVHHVLEHLCCGGDRIPRPSSGTGGDDVETPTIIEGSTTIGELINPFADVVVSPLEEDDLPSRVEGLRRQIEQVTEAVSARETLLGRLDTLRLQLDQAIATLNPGAGSPIAPPADGSAIPDQGAPGAQPTGASGSAPAPTPATLTDPAAATATMAAAATAMAAAAATAMAATAGAAPPVPPGAARAPADPVAATTTPTSAALGAPADQAGSPDQAGSADPGTPDVPADPAAEDAPDEEMSDASAPKTATEPSKVRSSSDSPAPPGSGEASSAAPTPEPSSAPEPEAPDHG